MTLRSNLAFAFITAGCLVITLPLSSSAIAQDAAWARLLASNCASCHGTDGRSQGGLPSLAGLPKPYIVQQMQDFRSGKRVATVMHQLAKGYTDTEIELIAGYLAAVPR